MKAISSNFTPWEEKTIALAGVAQCAALVHNLAQHGEASRPSLVASVNSLLVINPESVEEIYPNLGCLSHGFRTLQDIFSNDQLRENAQQIKYLLGLLVLKNKLMNNKVMQDKIRASLSTTPPLQDDTLLAPDALAEAQQIPLGRRPTIQQLATLYQDTISTLPYRIQVQGQIEYLKDETIANTVRAVLFSGIRAAVLWTQLGGRRWQLILHRKRIQTTAGDLRRKLIM